MLQAELISNRSNKNHQTWGPFLSQPLYEAAALQGLIGRAIRQVEGLTRGEEGREGGEGEGGALANELG